MSLTIVKEGNKNFQHQDADYDDYGANDITIIFDGNNVKLRSLSGRIIFNKDGYNYTDVTIIDNSTGGGSEVFANVVLLKQRLINLGYPFQGGLSEIVLDTVEWGNLIGDILNQTDLIAYISAISGVNISGTPLINQVAIFTDADTIKGESGLVFVGNNLGIGAATPSERLVVNGNAVIGSNLSADKLWGGNRSGSGTYDLDVSTNENTSGTLYTARIVTQNSQGSLLTFTSRALNGTANYTGSTEQTNSKISGIYGTTNSTGGRVNIQAGGEFSSQYSGSNTGASASSLYGILADVRVTGNGDINHIMAFKANPPILTGTSTTDYNWGMYIADQDSANANNSSAIHIEGDGIGNAITWSGNGGSASNIQLYSDGTSSLVLASASLTADSFVKSGATSDDVLLGDGSTMSLRSRTVITGTSATTYDLDISAGIRWDLEATGNLTLTYSNPVIDGDSNQIYLTTGGFGLTVPADWTAYPNSESITGATLVMIVFDVLVIDGGGNDIRYNITVVE